MAKTFTKQSISDDLAGRMIDAAAKKAKSIGTPMTISICDESGILKAYRRMDGAALLSIQIAQDKASTAAGFGIPTHQWHDFIKDDPPLAAGFPKVPGLIIFGGAYPIMSGKNIIGGIGVSGGHYTQDMVCAEAASPVTKRGR